MQVSPPTAPTGDQDDRGKDDDSVGSVARVAPTDDAVLVGDAARSDRSVLRDPVFARLWFIQAANQIGGNMALYALTVLVYSYDPVEQRGQCARSCRSCCRRSCCRRSPASSSIGSTCAGRSSSRTSFRTGADRRARAGRREHPGRARAQPRDQPDERRAHPGRGLDDPAGRPAAPSSRPRWACSTSRSRRRSRSGSRSSGRCS